MVDLPLPLGPDRTRIIAGCCSFDVIVTVPEFGWWQSHQREEEDTHRHTKEGSLVAEAGETLQSQVLLTLLTSQHRFGISHCYLQQEVKPSGKLSWMFPQ